jgi:Holliday junction DNA helicase RuvA
MICYLQGRLLHKGEDRITLLSGGVGYEVMIPPVGRRMILGLRSGTEGDEINLFISYHHGPHQTRPLLIGFQTELEREFFEKLLTVEDMGPTAAARALSRPIAFIARAIEERDVAALTRLDGIGPRKAEKIIASLNGKVGKYALMSEEEELPIKADKESIVQEALSALVGQLGYRAAEAKKAVQEALSRKPEMDSAEEIFEEIFRGKKTETV